MAKKKQVKPHREYTKRQLSLWQRQKKRQRIIFLAGLATIVAALVTVGVGSYLNQYRPLHETVIRVNDTEFDMGYYLRTLKIHVRGQPAEYVQYVADEVVTVIQRNEMVRQGATELGISVNDDEVDEKLKSYDTPLGKDYRDAIRHDMLLEKMRYTYFEMSVPVSAEQRHVMAMLLESEDQAAEIKARLEAGEDFGKLAGELSLDTYARSLKGDLGWRPREILREISGSTVLEEHAFNAGVGVLSQPIYDEDRTKIVGYWLVKVLERKDGPEEAHVRAMLLGSAEEVLKVKARLGAGEDFRELAQELSQHDPSKADGGDLGWLIRDEMDSINDFIFDPEVELETVSEPIRDETAFTTGGYWLLKVVDMDDNKDIANTDRDLLREKALNEWVVSLGENPDNVVENLLDSEKKWWAISRVIRELELDLGG